MMKTIKTMFKTFFIGWLFVLMGSTAAMSFDGEAALKRVDDIRAPGDDFSFTVQVETDAGKNRTMNVSVKDKTKGLVRFIRPAKVEGRAILYVNDNMWIYVQGTRRALRISSRQRVLGGVSSADVARTVYSIDYKVSSVSVIDDGAMLQLEPRTKAAAYGQIDIMIDETGAPLEAIFFDGSRSRKLKTMTFGEYADILGERRPTLFKIVDHINGDAVTTMRYSDFSLTETPDAWYQPSYLPRL
jgi:hypothetical protein